MSLAQALLFGLLMPVVLRMNETLGRTLGQGPAAWGIHVVGTLAGAVLLLPFLGFSWTANVARVPWWGWCGGIVGLGLVVLANRAQAGMGTAAFLAITVAVQLASGALIDHFGLLGSGVNPVSLQKVGGMVLLVAGAVLVVRG